MSRPRVAVLGLIHESNSFSHVITGFDAFSFEAGGGYVTGEDLWEHTAVGGSFASHEISGLLRGASKWAEAVPILFAEALPSGPVSADALQRLWKEAEQRLTAAGPFDGVLASTHGAAVGRSHLDFDGEWLRRIRQLVGPSVPVVGTLDCHANVSPLMVDSVDAFFAYRTNPHIDHRETGERGADLLRRMLVDGLRPRQALVQLPLILAIDRQASADEPCASWLAMGRDLCKSPGVIECNLLLGYPWADVPEMGVSVHVVGGEGVDVEAIAQAWAEAIWQDRERARSQATDVEAAIDRLLSKPGTVGLLDLGDNVGAGSYGDSTFLAHALRRRQVGPTFINLADAECLQRLADVATGEQVDLQIGGRLGGGVDGGPLSVRGIYRGTFDGCWTDKEPLHGGRHRYDEGPLAIVEEPEGLLVQVSHRPLFPASRGQITCCGLELASFRAIVLKGVNAPVTAYKPLCRELIACDTPGVTAAGLQHFNFGRRRRPLFPLEHVTERDATFR